jgi:hypothetical protein
LTLRLTALVLASATLAAASLRPAVPLEPIGAILSAAKRVKVIAFGEYHGSRATHVFLRSLISDPRFAEARLDVVVEFGNARYQDILDRYIAGEDVSESSLQRVWNYTTVGKGIWGRESMYPEFFRAARAANAALPPTRRFRVLAGDPPVDWERDDLGGFVPGSGFTVRWPTNDERYNRDFHAVDVIRREVLAKGRRAFAIYGGHHMMRGQNMIPILEERFREKTFVITAPIAHDLEFIQPSIASWPIPSLAMVQQTVLAPFDSELLLKAKRDENTAGAYYDAVLYLGPARTLTKAYEGN